MKNGIRYNASKLEFMRKLETMSLETEDPVALIHYCNFYG